MKTVSNQWSKMPNSEKEYYKEQSKIDRKRYEEQKNAYDLARNEGDELEGKKRSLRERRPKQPEIEETLPERKSKPKKKKQAKQKVAEKEDEDTQEEVQKQGRKSPSNRKEQGKTPDIDKMRKMFQEQRQAASSNSLLAPKAQPKGSAFSPALGGKKPSTNNDMSPPLPQGAFE